MQAGRVRLRPNRGFPCRLAGDVTPNAQSFESITICVATGILKREIGTLLGGSA
jgi:hypothetical protein